MWKRILALMLAMLVCFSAMTMLACANEDDTPDDEGDEAPSGTDDQPDEVDEEEPRLPIDYLPIGSDFGGAQMHVLEWSANGQTEVGQSWIPWEEIDVDARDGDTIGEAIYDRNGTVEEAFGVVITKEYVSIDGAPAYATVVRANEESGDQAYQMITCRTVNISPFCMEGMMHNMYEQEYLHTDMPWWSADSVRSYTMGEALYFAAPEMLLRDKGATAAVFYNHKVASDNEVTGLYELAEDGEWTWEVMLEYAEDVAADMDGDDLISSTDDMYGLDGGGRDIPFYLFNGAGLKFAEINDEGYLELTFGTDDNYTIVWQDVLDYVLFTDFYVANNLKNPPSEYNAFKNDRALFRPDMVKRVMLFRDMESDYGVLPVPKYDSYQENYSSLVWMHHDSVLGIPGSVTNVDQVCAVLEYLSYISYYEVYPIFYDNIILGRSARDEESKQMLELVFSVRSFDPGQYWLANQTNGFLTMFENNNRNVSSLWASTSGAMEAAVEEFNERIDEIGS